MKQELPKELLKELAYYDGPGKEYSARDLVISYMANAGRGVSTNELITYVWRVSNKVIKRTYLYQMLYKLRKALIIVNGAPRLPDNVKTFKITSMGAEQAKPFIKVKGQ